jgi:HEAT repeat protein
LAAISDLALLSFEAARKPLARAMDSDKQWDRYWACITASVFGDLAKPLVPDAKKLLSDENLMVRARAAEFLGSIKALDPMPTLVGVLNESDSPQEILLTFNTVVYLRDYKGYAFDLSKVKLKIKAGESSRRTDYLSGKGKL